jgi:hypothetical protein
MIHSLLGTYLSSVVTHAPYTITIIFNPNFCVSQRAVCRFFNNNLNLYILNKHDSRALLIQPLSTQCRGANGNTLFPNYKLYMSHSFCSLHRSFYYHNCRTTALNGGTRRMPRATDAIAGPDNRLFTRERNSRGMPSRYRFYPSL